MLEKLPRIASMKGLITYRSTILQIKLTILKATEKPHKLHNLKELHPFLLRHQGFPNPLIDLLEVLKY